MFFAHLLILEYPDHHQHLISSTLHYPGSLHEISFQSIYNVLSNVVHRQTNQTTPWTNRQTNATKNTRTLRERRPPWPRQIITPILPTVKMLSLGGERLRPPSPRNKTKKPPKNKKKLDHYLHHDLGMPPLLWCFVLLIYSSYNTQVTTKFNQFFIVLPRTPP